MGGIRFLFSAGVAALISMGMVMSAHAIEGSRTKNVFYDPGNAASPTGYTIGHELFRTIGCPGRGLLDRPCEVVDSDGDGVFDYRDKCPDTPAGRKVNEDGCELDSDGDGIVDGDDRCPTVYAKTPDGCPLAEALQAEPAPAPVPPPGKLVLEGVNFEYDKATLRAEAFAKLDQAAAELKAWGDGKVEIAGHTDSRGSERYNMKLSLRRANAVRDYLIGKGIAAERLIARGYGESQPVADNGTVEGRYRNRRVELLPIW
jgi:OOP family OmpA-OmpF porin